MNFIALGPERQLWAETRVEHLAKMGKNGASGKLLMRFIGLKVFA